MFAYIGKYTSYVGPYQIADSLSFLPIHQRDLDNLGDWLNSTWVKDVCEWVESKRKRTIIIKTHHYDSWGADSTIALIALPIIKQLKRTKQGAPLVEDEYVPEHLRSTNAPPKENDWDTDELWFDRWEWVLNEIIWSLEQVNTDWEEQYYSGTIDMEFVPCEDDSDLSEMVKGPNDTFKVDYEGRQKHQDRISNGLKLFGVFFQNLWD